MKDRQRNQLDAAQATYDYLLQPERVPIWSPLEAFGEAVTKIEGSLAILHTLIQVQAGTTGGITANKDRLRRSLQNRVRVLAKAAAAFGQAIPEPDLVSQAKAHDSLGELAHIADALLADHALLLHDRTREARDAAPVLAAKYGLRKDSEDTILAPVLAAATAYSVVVQDPRAAIVRRAGATAGIEAELRRLQGVLKEEIDNLIVQFETDQPAFVRDYFATRRIIDRGQGTDKPTDPPPPNN